MGDEHLDTADLTSCDREPITRLDGIQDFGFLMAVASDWTIVRVSANIERHLGIAPEALLGAPLSERIARAAQHAIRNRVAVLYLTGSDRLFGIKLVGSRSFDLAIHYRDGLLVIEGEPSQRGDATDAASLVRGFTAQLGNAETLDRFHRIAARQVKSITHFDRVMIYRFDEAGHGEVIAEAISAGMESFLGLHYPASDIPQQARRLYLSNPFRIIADATAPAVPLLPPADSVTPVLDLTLAVSRAVSPVHLEYLRNMKVGASLSISIIVDGRLWGLIACHAKEPRLPSFIMRTAAELYGTLYGFMLSARLGTQAIVDDNQVRGFSDRLVTAAVGDERLLTNAEWLQANIGDVIPCDGVALFRASGISCVGDTPSRDDIREIAQKLNIASPNRIYATDRLTRLQPSAAATVAQAAGMLSIPISRTPRDYVMLFRRERRSTISWGGDPAKALEPSPDEPGRLFPRKSFAIFTEIVEGTCLPFSERDRRIADAVRFALIEVILQNADESGSDRRQSSEKQEVLIAELNHRVRNILALIRSLITQTERNVGSVQDYVGSLNGRIQALARAHDRVTKQSWGPTPLMALFEDEIASLPGARNRLVVIGPSVMLQPTATSTMALVVHELVTNACKHGSLSGTGRVEVLVDLVPEAGVTIRWREYDGPPVKAPTRRGFGSTIIERTVPFDLQGTAEVRYRLTGIEADYFIPLHHLAAEAAGLGETLVTAVSPPASPPPSTETLVPILDGQSVLVVEDNMLIAMETEDALRLLGAEQVTLVSTLAQATRFVDVERFDLALLDINLGNGTTFDLANRLKDMGKPFIFASGYGDEVGLSSQLSGAIVLQKPFERSHLEQALQRIMAEVA